MYHQGETRDIISACGIPKCIYLKRKHPSTYSQSHYPCEGQADGMPRGPGLHQHRCRDSQQKGRGALWAAELSLSAACLEKLYMQLMLCLGFAGTWGIRRDLGDSQGPEGFAGTWGIHSSFGSGFVSVWF